MPADAGNAVSTPLSPEERVRIQTEIETLEARLSTLRIQLADQSHLLQRLDDQYESETAAVRHQRTVCEALDKDVCMVTQLLFGNRLLEEGPVRSRDSEDPEDTGTANCGT